MKKVDDFLKDDMDKKEICNSCVYDYLEADACRSCWTEVQIEKLLDNWYQHADFKKLATYKGINLGELSRYYLRYEIVMKLFVRSQSE